MGNLPELFDLSGRVAVVTGGAGLLGIEFCQTLFESGANTIIADIDEAAADKIAASLNSSGSERGKNRAYAVQVDVSKKDSVQDLIQRSLAEFGEFVRPGRLNSQF